MIEQASIPPRAPRYKSILRLQRFMDNPIPFMNENLKKYGDTYCFSLRYNKMNILTIDPDIIQHVLRKNAENYEKPVKGTEALARFVGTGILLARGEEHKRQRKLMAPSFRPKKLSKLISLMDHEIDSYLDAFDLRIQRNSAFTIDDEMRALTFRVMSKAIFGDDMSAEMIDDFSDRFQTLQDFLLKLVRIPRLMKWYNLTGKTKYYEQLADKNNQVILDIIAKRRERKLDDDLLGVLMGSTYENSETGMSDKQLQNESLILFVAGHETTANILSWIFYLLTKHPECIERIKAEAKETLEDRLPEFEDLLKLTYLSQVIDECLRLYPPSWITSRVALEDDEIKGFKIPKGARVIPFIYGLHHSSELWPNAEQFDPSRFTKENRTGRHNFAHMPFGAGPRMCLGRNFAMMEMKMIILKFINRYNFDLIKGQKISILPSVTLKPRHGIRFRMS